MQIVSKEIICMKCQSLFWGEIRKKIKMSSDETLMGNIMLKLKRNDYILNI